MPSENRGGGLSHALRVLAGLETGILGGLAMLSLLVSLSRLLRRPLWALCNVLGATFWGRAALAGDFGWPTVSGIGLLLFSAGVIGMGFGILVGESRNRLRVLLLGILAGLGWYYFLQALLWKKLGALANLYVTPRSLLAGHVVFGLVLGCYPMALAAARRHFGVAQAIQPAAGLPPGP